MIQELPLFDPQYDAAASARIIEAVRDAEQPKDEWISKRGVKVQLKKVSPFISMEIAKQIPDPPVPVYYDKESERERENPLDPNYNQNLQTTRMRRGMVAMDANLALGTKLISWPKDMSGPDDTDWVDLITVASEGLIEIPDKGIGRYLAWLRYWSLGEELSDLSEAVLRYSGVVMEADVALASETFQDNEERPTIVDTEATEAD